MSTAFVLSCVLPSHASASCTFQTNRSTLQIPYLHAKHGLSALSRRDFLSLSFCTAGISLLRGEHIASAAEDEVKSSKPQPDTPIDAIISFFDSDEKTKTGKVLPKSYLKSARQVVKTLKESFKEDSKNEASVRRSADAARGAIRDYLQNWRGQGSVSSEESYKALETAFKILGDFYSKKGPRAILSSDVKSQVLENLELAEAAL